MFSFSFVQTLATPHVQRCYFANPLSRRRCYSAPLVQHVVVLFSLDLLFCLSCSTCYFAPLAQCCCPSYSMLSFYSFCSMLLLFLLNTTVLCLFKYLSAIPLLLLLLVPLALDWHSIPSFFLQVSKNCPNSNSSS